MRHVWRNERGMALAVAIFALVVVGALVAGSFFIGTQEQRMGENQYRSQQAFSIAEAAAPEIIKTWDPDSFNVMRFFPADTYKLDKFGPRPLFMGMGTGSFGGSVFKLNRNVYLMDITGMEMGARAGSAALRRRGGGGRSRIGILTRIRPLQIPSQASLTTQGSVRLGGNAAVDGTDQIPNLSWSTCQPPDTTKAGVRTTPTGTVDIVGTQAEVNGSPPVMKDQTVTDSTFNVFGEITFADLTAMANIVMPPQPAGIQTFPQTLVSGQCDKTKMNNWGDGLNHAGPCGTYFPIIYIQGLGSTVLNGVQGQGILLADGDLKIQGSYEFFGVVIIKGSLSTAGGGTSVAHIWGAAMAQNVDLDLTSLSGNATLNYSKCAITQALQWTGLTAYMRSRGFVGLY